LLCQLLGETLVQLASLTIPSPVLGLLLLLGWLFLRGGVADEVGRAANTLLAHLSLLFVPAGVDQAQGRSHRPKVWDLRYALQTDARFAED